MRCPCHPLEIVRALRALTYRAVCFRCDPRCRHRVETYVSIYVAGHQYAVRPADLREPLVSVRRFVFNHALVVYVRRRHCAVPGACSASGGLFCSLECAKLLPKLVAAVAPGRAKRHSKRIAR